jgi:hypothetical protein
MPLARLSKTPRLDRSPPCRPLATRPRRHHPRQRHPALPTPPPTPPRQPLGNQPPQCRLLADPADEHRPTPNRPPHALEKHRLTRPPQQAVSMRAATLDLKPRAPDARPPPGGPPGVADGVPPREVINLLRTRFNRPIVGPSQGTRRCLAGRSRPPIVDEHISADIGELLRTWADRPPARLMTSALG